MEQDNYEIVVEYIVTNQENFYRLAYSYVRAKQDALDIVQNAICKALENYRSLRNQDALRTWFYRILVNESISFIKKNKKEVSSEKTGAIIDELQAKDYKEENPIDSGSLYQKINELPLELQHIIKLHYFEEMTLVDVAAVMDMNVNTIKAKLYRGLRKIKVKMEEDELWAN